MGDATEEILALEAQAEMREGEKQEQHDMYVQQHDMYVLEAIGDPHPVRLICSCGEQFAVEPR